MTNNLTRGGVCKDLTKSPFVFTYIHNGKQVNLFFSSKLHLDKFTKNRKKNYVMIYNDIQNWQNKIIKNCLKKIRKMK